LFIDNSIPDIHVQVSSPAKNSGQIIQNGINGDTDIDGSARIVDNKISIGAHQVL
jgi:hypothetical protein